MKKYLGIAAIFAICVPFMASCSTEEVRVLRVYNCEDYMLETNEEDGVVGLTDRFVEFMADIYGEKVKVIYDTYDTNESMLSQVKTGKVRYDLICPSDYAIQKMIAEDLIIPFEDENHVSTTPLYDQNASKFLLNKLDNIEVKVNKDGKSEVLKNQLNRYAKGYMWGTLGLLVNPEFVDIEDFKDNYSMLWDAKYRNKISVKDSQRDTYAIGILEAFRPEFEELRTKYLAGEISGPEYNKQITEHFNRCDQETLDKVLASLQNLKSNIFGFEVDSGKQDIQQGKIYINTAWSGDATYAMDTALEETGTVLKYILPDIGANIWFDGWVMPKGADVELASHFINFLSMPENAVDNMDEIGYTPFTACEEVFEYIKETYATPEEEIENIDDYFKKDLSYFFKNDESDETDYSILIENELRYTQIDTQYPDEDKLNSLCIMDDFGPNTKNVIKMWEKLKNTSMPAYFYYIVLGGIGLLIGFIIFRYVMKIKKRRDRILRLKARAKAK